MKKKTSVTLLLFGVVMMVLFCMPASAETKKSKALKAYKSFLAKQQTTPGTLIEKWGIVFLNDDNIPDLVTFGPFGKPCVYTYKKKKVTLVNVSAGNLYYSHYYRKKSVILGDAALGNATSDWDYKAYYKIDFKKSDLIPIGIKENGKYYVEDPATYQKKQITKKRLNVLLKKQVEKTKATKIKYYKNTAKNRNKYLK